MSQNSKAGPGTDIDTLLEIGLPPGEVSQPSPGVPVSAEKPSTSFAMVLPPRADSQSVAKEQDASVAGEEIKLAVTDPLRPRLRRPEKEGQRRRNRRKTTVVRETTGSARTSDKYELLLGSRPCLHAVWSLRRITSKAAPLAVAAYYIDEDVEAWAGLKQPAHALLPIVRSSSVDYIGAADCTINRTVFQTDVFKGRRSLFRFDSMRPVLEDQVYDSRNALLKVIANTFTPRAGFFGSRDMQNVS
jgi:hypothetical protein